MNISLIQSDQQMMFAGREATSRNAEASFERQLRELQPEDQASSLRPAANQLVASALLMPVMNLLSESTLAVGPFQPSSAEQHFRPLLNQHLTDGITRAANFPIIDSIVERYTTTGGSVDAQG